MRHNRLTNALLLLLAAVGAVLPVAPAYAAAPEGGDVVLVRVTGGRAAAVDAVAQVGGGVEDRLLPGVYKVRVPRGTGAAAIRRLTADPRVVYAQPDHVVRIAAVPDDPCLDSPPECWGLHQVRAPAAWDVTTGSSSVVVAVLDTGVPPAHEDLGGKIIAGGNHTDDLSVMDGHGHGTHVAGIVAADTDNGIGVAGLGWNTRARAVKVLQNNGVGSHSTVVAGIQEAIDAGVEVINMSFAGPTGPALADAVNRARAAGIVVVAAAGNDEPNDNVTVADVRYPAALPGVIGVAATDSNDNLASFSHRGSWVSVAAPGVSIVSTWVGNTYQVVSGTSMAAPHVSAAAALLFAAEPGITADQVRARLATGATRISGTGADFQWGRLDVLAALRPPQPGYWFVASDGGVFAFGAAPYRGSAADVPLTHPIVGMSATPTKSGYWLVGGNGAVFAYGDARPFGGLDHLALNASVLGVEAHPSGAGYWMVASDGGVFSFGDARFHGSTGDIRLNQPVVGMTSTPTGDGYWMVARDGGIFAFGGAQFFGSMGGTRLNQPVVGMAATPTGKGYWLVAADGGMFSFGDARFFGSTGAIRLNRPIVGMRPTPTGHGYWLVASDGGVFAFGDAAFLGSTGDVRLNRPIVGMAA